MWERRPLRVGAYTWIGFIVGSLILGTIKGNAFVDNLVYGIWTGAIGAAVVGTVIWLLESRK